MKFTFLFLLLLASPVVAKDYEILMLNYGEDGGMVFEPGFLRAEVGDSITFIPNNTGHYVKSYFLPDGVKEWQSVMDGPFTVTLEAEGVYIYECPPHLMMGMVGVIQVGEAVNKDAAHEASIALSGRITQNKGRLESYIEAVE